MAENSVPAVLTSHQDASKGCASKSTLKGLEGKGPWREGTKCTWSDSQGVQIKERNDGYRGHSTVLRSTQPSCRVTVTFGKCGCDSSWDRWVKVSCLRVGEKEVIWYQNKPKKPSRCWMEALVERLYYTHWEKWSIDCLIIWFSTLCRTLLQRNSLPEKCPSRERDPKL